MSRSGLRVLTVLDALERAGRPRTAAQVARSTLLPEATAWRMLQTLTEWGGVERHADGTYRIATRLWAVGSSAPCVRRLQRGTAPHLRSLHESTGMDAALSVYDGTDAIVVLTCGDRHGLREGDRVPVTPDGPALGRLLSSARDLDDPTAGSISDDTTIARAITDPSGAVVAVVSLAGHRDERHRGTASTTLAETLPRLRFSIYQDELFA